MAISTIGCGADANPRRLPPERAVEAAEAHGKEIAAEVERLVRAEKTEITASPDARYGYAGLPIDRPPIEELKKRLEDGNIHVRRHAKSMLEIHHRMGRLPESYPCRSKSGGLAISCRWCSSAVRCVLSMPSVSSES